MAFEKLSKFVIGGILTMNFLDLFLSLWLIHWQKVASEDNPIMDFYLKLGSPYFISIKVAIALLAGFILWHFRRRILTQIGSYVVFVTYWVLMCHYLSAFVSF